MFPVRSYHPLEIWFITPCKPAFLEKAFIFSSKKWQECFAVSQKPPTFAPAFGNEAVLIERLSDWK